VRGGSNPGGPGALFLREFFIDKNPSLALFPKYRPNDYAFIPARLYDNPYLDPAYIERLEQLPEARQRQLINGDWDVFIGQFFSAFSPADHVTRLEAS
jgi:phage terminase large subunit